MNCSKKMGSDSIFLEHKQRGFVFCGKMQDPKVPKRIFSYPDVLELINLQRDGGKAKPYLVRQVRAIIHQYKLGAEE